MSRRKPIELEFVRTIEYRGSEAFLYRRGKLHYLVYTRDNQWDVSAASSDGVPRSTIVRRAPSKENALAQLKELRC